MSKYDEKIVFKPTEFDYVNPNAEVVIVGITPGNNQIDGSREGLTKREIKCKYAFAGGMRPNLVKMLDFVGVNHILGIASCSSLWGDDFDRVEMTSLLKEATYEVNRKGEEVMFKDARKIAKSEKLTWMLNNGFVSDCSQYGHARLFVACGSGVYNVLKELQDKGAIIVPVIGITHPSGANLGRVLCYLGQKEPQDDSYQWCVEKALEAKEILRNLENQKKV